MSISVCVFVCLSVDRACAEITRPIYYKFSHNFYFMMYCLCQIECTRKGFCMIQVIIWKLTCCFPIQKLTFNMPQTHKTHHTKYRPIAV